MAITIISFFTNKGVPATGLSPVIDIWKKDGTQVVTNQAMIEIAGGSYFYDFAAYDDIEDYFIRTDSIILTGNERYQGISNTLGQVTNPVGTILKINANRFKIDTTTNTLTIYEDDKTTPSLVFDLKDAAGVAAAQNVFERVPQ